MAENNAAGPGRITFADTHCHLDFEAFTGDRDEVIISAKNAGVRYLVNPAVDLVSSKEIVKIANQTDGMYAGVGVHPNDALSWDADSYNQLKEMSGAEKVVAIGEIGLDYYRDRAPKELQINVFLSLLRLAKEVELPVILHTRQSIPDVLSILKDWKYELQLAGSSLYNRPGVLHSFSGSTEEAWQAIELGFFIGITGPVTFKNAAELQSMVVTIPLEHLLIETDAPFLTPHPMRGKRNEPAYVLRVAEKISKLKDISLEEVGVMTTANAEKLFFGERLVE